MLSEHLPACSCTILVHSSSNETVCVVVELVMRFDTADSRRHTQTAALPLHGCYIVMHFVLFKEQLSEHFKAKVFTPPIPFPSSSSCSLCRVLPFCPEVFVQCHGGRDQTVLHLREAGETQASASSYGEDGCSDQHARLQRPTTPGKGQHELQHWDDSRVPMTICSSQGKTFLSNVSGAVPETRDNGIDGITRYTINHSDIGTLTKHGQLKMAASATQVWQHSPLYSTRIKEIWGKDLWSQYTQIISFKSDVYVRNNNKKTNKKKKRTHNVQEVLHQWKDNEMLFKRMAINVDDDTGEDKGQQFS